MGGRILYEITEEIFNQIEDGAENADEHTWPKAMTDSVIAVLEGEEE